MNTFSINAVAVAVGLAFSAGALAQGMPKEQLARAGADYTMAGEKCDAFAGDAKSNCVNEAKARFGKS